MTLTDQEALELGKLITEAFYPASDFGELGEVKIQSAGRMAWKIVKRWEGESQDWRAELDGLIKLMATEVSSPEVSSEWNRLRLLLMGHREEGRGDARQPHG